MNKNMNVNVNFDETTSVERLTQVTKNAEDINNLHYSSIGMSNEETTGQKTAAMPENGTLFINHQANKKGSNRMMTRSGKEFGYGKQVDLWCADNAIEAQDAVRTLQANKNHRDATYTQSKPTFGKKTSVKVTTDFKPSFVFGNEHHQKFIRELAERVERRK